MSEEGRGHRTERREDVLKMREGMEPLPYGYTVCSTVNCILQTRCSGFLDKFGGAFRAFDFDFSPVARNLN